MQMSRRSLLSSIFATAVAGSLLTDKALGAVLSTVEVEDRVTKVLRLAREAVALNAKVDADIPWQSRMVMEWKSKNYGESRRTPEWQAYKATSPNFKALQDKVNECLKVAMEEFPDDPSPTSVKKLFGKEYQKATVQEMFGPDALKEVAPDFTISLADEDENLVPVLVMKELIQKHKIALDIDKINDPQNEVTETFAAFAQRYYGVIVG